MTTGGDQSSRAEQRRACPHKFDEGTGEQLLKRATCDACGTAVDPESFNVPGGVWRAASRVGAWLYVCGECQQRPLALAADLRALFVRFYTPGPRPPAEVIPIRVPRPLLDDERRCLRAYATTSCWPTGMTDECFIACRSELFRRGFIATRVRGRGHSVVITEAGRKELLERSDREVTK